MATLAPNAPDTEPLAAAPAVRLVGIRRVYGDVVAVAGMEAFPALSWAVTVTWYVTPGVPTSALLVAMVPVTDQSVVVPCWTVTS